MSTTSKKIKKSKKSVPTAVVYITAHFNNTHVVVSDIDGKVLSWASGGSAGFKGARESTPYAAQIVSEKALDSAKKSYGVQEVSIIIKGIGKGRDQAIRWVVNSEVDITTIQDITPVSHNGCRRKKVRKL